MSQKRAGSAVGIALSRFKPRERGVYLLSWFVRGRLCFCAVDSAGEMVAMRYVPVGENPEPEVAALWDLLDTGYAGLKLVH